jgi:hypothetical protein
VLLFAVHVVVVLDGFILLVLIFGWFISVVVFILRVKDNIYDDICIMHVYNDVYVV